jgi:hypothetical protein
VTHAVVRACVSTVSVLSAAAFVSAGAGMQLTSPSGLGSKPPPNDLSRTTGTDARRSCHCLDRQLAALAAARGTFQVPRTAATRVRLMTRGKVE